jgi:hypothetical protein
MPHVTCRVLAARAICNTVLHATAAAGEVSFATVAKMVSWLVRVVRRLGRR